VAGQVPQHALAAAQLVELVEHQLNHCLHLKIGVERHPSGWEEYIADWHMIEERATPSLMPPPLLHPLAD
jgi:hypothetical protein